jgi:hypothetical protein
LQKIRLDAAIVAAVSGGGHRPAPGLFVGACLQAQCTRDIPWVKAVGQTIQNGGFLEGAGMSQSSLFDASRPPQAVEAAPVEGGDKTLSKEHKRFRQLIGKIERQRALLKQWEDFMPGYRLRFGEAFLPLNQQLDEKRREMVFLLDRSMADKALGKTHRAKVRNILLGLLEALLATAAGAPDPELVRIHDRHSDLSFDEARQEDMALTQAIASEMFGVDIGAEHGAESPEALEQMIAEKVRAAEAERAERRASRKKSPKTLASEARQAQAEQEVGQSVREVYRKLASGLHPDREPDPAQRAQKTELMQQANRAYEAGDLLALLMLHSGLAGSPTQGVLDELPPQRLQHYNAALQAQLRRLEEALAEATAPFADPRRGARGLTPASVMRSLAAEIEGLQAEVAQLTDDLLAFRDIKALKSFLRDYQVEDADDDFGFLDDLMRANPPPGWR